MSSSRNNNRTRCRALVVFLFAAQFWSSCLAFIIVSPGLVPARSNGSPRVVANPKPLSVVFSSSSPDSGEDTFVSEEEGEGPFENVAAAVIVPGFLTGADEFEPLCKALTERGIPTVAVPMPNWHWLPCLGGRSARPILERIDHTVKHIVANYENTENPIIASNAILNIPEYKYSVFDCWMDFQNTPGGALKVGGSSKVDDYPVVEPRGDFASPEGFRTGNGSKKQPKKKIALIGHSAGGWISRVYLSSSDYGGKVYEGSKYIHSLVTLGTPHSNAPGPAFEGIEWINRPENEHDRTKHVRTLAVAGNGFKGGDWGSLTQGAYSFCCPEGTDGTSYEGDGVTPLFSALDLPGSESLVLEGATHHFCWSDVFGGDFVAPELTEDHKRGQSWYGSEGVIEQWAKFIKDGSSG